MINSRSRLVLCSLFALVLSACCDTQQVSRQDLMTAPHFWQRAEATSAIYQRGPKAQQMLHRDIARCVTELRELEREGAIRYMMPGQTQTSGEMASQNNPEAAMGEWETPERNGYLRAEYMDYSDFEGCMKTKGWERIEHVPYDIAEEGRENYIEAVTGEKYQTKTRQRENFLASPKGDYVDLNN